LEDFINIPIITHALVAIESIAVKALGLWRFILKLLDGNLCSLPDIFKTHTAAGKPVYDCDDRDMVFLLDIGEQFIHPIYLDFCGYRLIGQLRALCLTHKAIMCW
jgi:hypothetical protein